jgi:hypothetical protein
MATLELRPGLWRWTAPHPAWRPDADWPRNVGCVAYATAAELVLVDPLVHDWDDLDRLVGTVALPVTIALTAPWHRRDAAAAADRYGAVLGKAPAAEELVVPPVGEGQVVLFLPAFAALVMAEILQDLGEGLRVCPSPALADPGELRPLFEALTKLPVELILLAHGPPVLEDARAQLARAVAPRAP